MCTAKLSTMLRCLRSANVCSSVDPSKIHLCTTCAACDHNIRPRIRITAFASSRSSSQAEEPLPSCGGGGNSVPHTGSPGTAPGTYTLTVTGSSTDLSHSTKVSLTVN